MRLPFSLVGDGDWHVKSDEVSIEPVWDDRGVRLLARWLKHRVDGDENNDSANTDVLIYQIRCIIPPTNPRTYVRIITSRHVTMTIATRPACERRRNPQKGSEVRKGRNQK